jgi:hypothetical protein
MKQFDTLEQIADYVDTCVCENFDINSIPEYFPSLRNLVAVYTDEILLTRSEFVELVQLCDTPSIRRLVK